MKQFSYERTFRSLSIKDLLDAREAYHIHLSHMNHVVGTAIGLYRIRLEDLEADGQTARRRTDAPRSHTAPLRTLANSKTTDWSWPCVLVFVDQWKTLEEMSNDPDQVVPQRLFLADGRAVPTCVVFAPQSARPQAELGALHFPAKFIGGGYPVLSVVQEREHVGSIGCLTTDGDAVYALTNRHVIGETGRKLFTVVGGAREFIGLSHKNALGKKAFTSVYRGWPGERVCVNLDAGLIRIDNINRWTAQVLNVGELGALLDMNVDTISLDLIGCGVRGFGAGSGLMKGRIDALFYRYRSVGGVAYVCDLLIGPRGPEEPVNTKPGDSGTLWVLDEPTEEPKPGELKQGESARPSLPRPLAVQWGGHVVRNDDGEGEMQFALATFASTICRELDVDIVPDFNTGHPQYWGRVGHYKIGAAACDLINDNDLRSFFQQNRDAIGYSDAAIQAGNPDQLTNQSEFIPLADVPDIAWKHKARSMEGPNHFADMDDPDDHGRDLLSYCNEETGENISVEFWNDFYANKGVRVQDRGCLPFRVWQIYDDMVTFVATGDSDAYLCAAGILAHYIGDACQPLHVSRLHHGGATGKNDPVGKVHDMYEQTMLFRNAAQFFTDLTGLLKSTQPEEPFTGGGKRAAADMVALMREAFETIQPETIVQVFKEVAGAGRSDHMWDKLHEDTEKLIVRGCVHLGKVWESAWLEGNQARRDNGHQPLRASGLGPVSQGALKKFYESDDFLPSVFLTHMQLKGDAVPA